MEHAHIPVLLDEVVAALDPRPGATVVDCTLGLGGHARELLRRVGPQGRLVGLDLDPANLVVARARLAEAGPNFDLRHVNFAGLPRVLGELGIARVHGVLADLGLSSPHVDDAARGFSYRRAGPLDMRMDPTRGPTAADLVNTMEERELADAIFELGDETDSRKIARLIVRRRPIRTTEELTAIVCEARRFTLARAAGAKLHPAARTFQALRILVNREMANLERLLGVLPDVLAPGGRAAIITFHSGEDRRVKHAFRDGLRAGAYAEIAGPIRPAPEERDRNPRSTAAKLRWALRAQVLGPQSSVLSRGHRRPGADRGPGTGD